MKNIKQWLYSMQDLRYHAFQSRLVPNIAPERIIGVRMPVLRSFAEALYGTKEAEQFLQVLPHDTYDENNLHALLIVQMDDYDRCVDVIDHFLPYVDNWATCDSLRPKCFAKQPERLLEDIQRWLASSHPYTIRFGMEMLMIHYLDAGFDAAQLAAAAAHKENENYYVQTMIAWYFATALAKQPSAALPYLTEHRLPRTIHNKTIQKALESYRVDEDLKSKLRMLRR